MRRGRVRGVSGGRHPAHPAPPADGPADRIRADRAGTAAVRARRRHPGPVQREGHLPYFWHNGAFPTTEEYRTLFEEGFASWRLKVHRLVEKPVHLSLMPVVAAIFVRVLPGGTPAAYAGAPAGPSSERPGVALPGRTSPGPALHGHRPAELGPATRQVRVTCAARRLYRLRTALAACDQPVRPGRLAARRVRRAERRAQGALARAGFADPAIAAAVLRHVQVLTVTAALARLDYRTADAAHVRRHETAVTAKRTGRTLAGATRTASPTFGTCPSHCTRPGADVAGW